MVKRETFDMKQPYVIVCIGKDMWWGQRYTMELERQRWSSVIRIACAVKVDNINITPLQPLQTLQIVFKFGFQCHCQLDNPSPPIEFWIIYLNAISRFGTPVMAIYVDLDVAIKSHCTRPFHLYYVNTGLITSINCTLDISQPSSESPIVIQWIKDA